MTTMHILMNHQITKDQIEDARTNLGVTSFKEVSGSLKTIFWHLNPEADTLMLYKEIITLLDIYFKELSYAGDYLLVQGEPVVTHWIVSWAEEALPELTCVAATTKRETVEVKQEDGSVLKTSKFTHVKFRAYTIK